MVRLSTLALGCVFLTGCGSPASTSPVESLTGSGFRDTASLTLKSLKGTRDGERLAVRALYADGEQSLSMDLHFKVVPPARLESGTWTGLAAAGTVRERSVTFLGGQSAPPSIGGRFDLIGPDNQALYRVSIPLQPLRDAL